MNHVLTRAKAFIICVALLLTAAVAMPAAAHADTTGIGTVVNVTSYLNVRSGAGSEYSAISSLYGGDTVTVLGSATASDGAKWYRVTFVKNGSTVTGYVHSDYLSVRYDSEYQPDGDFEKYMDEQGFPDSYKPSLRALHAEHPSWIFTTQNIGLDWETVLDEEMRIGRSLVPSSSLNSWKSFEQGAFNWDDDTYVAADGVNWVNASRQILAYCLDPRNYLNESYIFAFESLSYSPYHTADNLKSLFSGSFMAGAYPSDLSDSADFGTYADAFMQAARLANVSAFNLGSRALVEQGYSGSQLSFGTVPGYSGYYNFFNIGAYTTSDASAVVNGAKRAKSNGWTTPYKSIFGGAQFIGDGYINKGQDSLYLQKFDVVDGGNGYYSHQYMTNILAPQAEATVAKKGYSSEMLAQPIVFNIPIYKNMPDTACVKPTSNGNNNNLLRSLSVSDCSITPSFTRYTTEYELVVGSGTSSIYVDAVKSSSGASVSGAGNVPLNYGNNLIKIVVTAASGATRTYTLSVFREGSEPEPQPSPDPSVSSSSLKIGEYVTGVTVGDSPEQFLARLNVSNGSAKLENADGSAATAVGTGCLLKIYKTDGSLYSSTPVVVYGDTSGDGRISVLDILNLENHILNISTLSGVRLESCDTNKDGRVSVIDLLDMENHILNIKLIEQ